MIRSWGDGRSRRFYEGRGARGYRGMDVDKANNRLAALDAATSLSSLSPLKSLGLHKLKGNLRGHWAITVNGPWRVVFRFADGDAHDVSIVDYHKG